MRFGDFLKATVLLSAGAATLLAAMTVIGLSADVEDAVVYVSLGWWTAATLIGTHVGRRPEATEPIGRLLAGARSQPQLPELAPTTVLVNRLWPLLLSTFAAAVIAVWVPQVASIAAGFAIIWALAWRHQESAVAAIEERDGVRFYLDRTSAFRPIRLIRTPGFGGDYVASRR